VHSPAVVFLDEPTSGLDAFSALCVMESLRAMAEHGHAVACTLHQPRQAIVDMFDDVAFLSAGHLVYLGAPKGVQPWLLDVGLWDPSRAASESLSDIVLDCITVGFEKPEELYGRHTLRDEAELETLASALRDSRQHSYSGDASPKEFTSLEQQRPGPWCQYWTLQKQQVRIARRSPGTLAARVGLHFIIGILMGSVYFEMDRSFLKDVTGWDGMLPLQLRRLSSMPEDRVGVLFLLCLAQAVTPNCAMSFFMEDRQYYSRESAARLYGAVPYHVANAVTEALVCSVNAAVASGLATFMAGVPLSGNWCFTMCLLISHHMCSSAMVQMCARLAPNQDIAFVLSAGYVILCMLFANILVKVETVMPLLSWIRWHTSLYFAMAGLIETEFAGTEELGVRVGDKLADQFLIRWSELTLHSAECLACVWAFYAVFTLVGLLALKFLNKSQI